MNSASATALHPAADLDPQFAAVYRAHVDYVWTNLRRLGVPALELDDAVQETFLVAFRRWDDLRPGASWRAWLFGIARRVASHHRRGSARRLRLVQSAAHQPSSDPDARDDVALRDAARLVDHFLRHLPPRLREVFILSELEGHTGAEVAQALAIKPNTVGSRLRASRQNFDRYVQTLRARERGAAETWDRAALLRRTQDEQVPTPVRRRMMAALAVQVAQPLGVTTAATPIWLLALKPMVIAVGLSVVGLGTIAIGARALRGPTPSVPHATAVAPAQITPQAPQRQPLPPTPPPTPANERVVAPPVDPVTAAAAAAPRERRPAPATPVADPPTLGAELELLQAIRTAAKAGRHADALALAEAHATRFAAGELALERDVQRIAATCQLGRLAEARTLLDAFAHAHPSATLPAPIAAACKKATSSNASGQEG